MFIAPFGTGLSLGLDSFLTCLAMGMLPQRPVRRFSLALSFGLCDGIASWIGSAVGMEPLRFTLARSEWLGPVVVAGYGLFVLYLTWRYQNLGRHLAAQRWLVFSLPLGLSLDNLVAGVGAEASGLMPVSSALIFAVTSGGMALLGIWVGSTLGARSRFRAAWFSGALLILVAGGLVVKEVLLEFVAHG